MKRVSIPLLILAFLLAVILAAYQRSVTHPAITLKFYGTPAASLTVTHVPTFKKRVTNAQGQVEAFGRDTSEMLAVPLPSGGTSWIRFPRNGNKTIDFRGRRTLVHEVEFNFGVIKRESRTEWYSFTDEESEALASGMVTMEEVKQRIRNE